MQYSSEPVALLVFHGINLVESVDVLLVEHNDMENRTHARRHARKKERGLRLCVHHCVITGMHCMDVGDTIMSTCGAVRELARTCSSL